MVVLLLQYGASTAILDRSGQLYECREYDGCQSLIEKSREQHARLVMSALLSKDGVKKLKQVFLVSARAQSHTHSVLCRDLCADLCVRCFPYLSY